jgi:hypothetical protein
MNLCMSRVLSHWIDLISVARNLLGSATALLNRPRTWEHGHGPESVTVCPSFDSDPISSRPAKRREHSLNVCFDLHYPTSGQLTARALCRSPDCKGGCSIPDYGPSLLVAPTTSWVPLDYNRLLLFQALRFQSTNLKTT